MKIYIAGKITSDKNYKHKFRKAERFLRKLGHSVMNPAWIVPSDEFRWEDYMQISSMMQARCNAVYFLNGWKQSEGSKIEFKRSSQLNQKVYFEDSEFSLEELRRSAPRKAGKKIQK